jgi:site-specific DNA recombinase
MKKTIIYLRLRSDKDPAKSRTLHHQEKRFRDYCILNGIEIAGIYRENWLSGNTEHPVFREAVKKMEHGCGELSLMMHQRWEGTARRMWDNTGITEKFKALNVQARPVEPGIELTIIKHR